MPAQIGLLFLVYAAASAQAMLAPALTVCGVAPEFLLLVTLAAALWIRGWPALGWAALAGLTSDCLSARPLGAGMLATVVVVLFVQRALETRSALSYVRMACLCTGAMAVLILSRDAISAALTRDRIAPAALLSTAAVAAVYSAGIGIVFSGCRRMLSRICCPLFGSAA